MPSIQEIMNQYLGPVPDTGNVGISSQDALDVGAAVQNGRGDDFRDDVKRDLATLSPLEILTKYGPQRGQVLLGQRGRGEASYMQKRFANKTGFDVANDIVTGAGVGAVRGLGGTAAFVTGLANDRVGTAIGEFTSRLAEQGGLGRSRGGDTRAEAYDARTRVSNEESEVQYERDVQTSGDLVAGLRKVGRDVVNTWNNVTQDGSTVMDIASEGLGSLAGGVPIIRGAQYLGKAGQMIAARAGSARGVKAVDTGAVMAGIGVQAAGGSYSQVSDEIMGMSEQELSQSPDYLALRNEGGLSHEDAQIKLANSAGLKAGAMTLPFAALTGKLVDKFEAAPFAAGNARNFARNVAAETIEETLQGGQANIVSNLALQDADPGRSLIDGLGEEMVVGAIGGAGAAGLAQGPGATVVGAADAVRGAVGLTADAAGSLIDKAKARGAEIQAKMEAESPVSGAKASNALNTAIAKIKEAVAPKSTLVTEGVEDPTAEVAEATEVPAADAEVDPRLTQLFAAATYDETADLDETVPETIRATLAGSANKFEAMDRLIDTIEKAPEGSEEELAAARTLRTMFAQSGAALRTAVAAAEEAPEGNAAADAIRESAAAFKTLGSNAKVVNAMKNTVQRVLKQAVENGAAKVDDTTDVTTPEGRAKVQNAVAVAETMPAEADLETTERVLKMAEQGEVSLTNEQRAALLSSAALIQAEREALEASPENEKNLVNLVHNDVITDRDIDPDNKLPSLSGHTKRVVDAYRAGNTEEAAANLQELMLFAEHMQNKVDALNRHYENGGGPKGTGEVYNSLIPVGTSKKKRWVQSKKPIGIAANSESSVRFAQRVGAEAEMVAKVANRLAQIFPDLGLDEVTAVPLNPALQGDAKAVARRNWMALKDGNPLPGTQNARTTQEPTTTPTPVAGRSEAAQERRQAAPEVGAERQASEEAEDTKTQDTKTDDDSDVAAAEPAVKSKPETESDNAPAPEAAETAQPEGGDKSTEVKAPEKEAETETDEAEPAPVEETVEPEAVTEPEPAVTEADEARDPYDLVGFFPSLVGQQLGSKIRNLFLKAFRYPEKRTSILAGMTNPVDTVNDWIQGSGDVDRPVKRAYEAFLGNALSLANGANAALRDYLSKPYSKSDTRSNLQVLADGKLNLYASGRALNLIERVDGKVRYNPELLETAAVAAAQWFLHIPQHKFKLNEDSDLYDLLDLNEDDAWVLEGREDELINRFNEGVGLVAASRSLGKMIRDYWGVVPQKGAPRGQVEGISEGLAKELLEAMVRQGMLTESEPVEVVFGKRATVTPGKEKTEGLVGMGLKSPTLFTAAKLSPDVEAVKRDVDLIERTVKTDPDEMFHVGQAPKKVRQTLLHTRTKHSKGQLAALEARQNNAFRPNLFMVDFFRALGEDGVGYAFGSGKVSENRNQAHADKLFSRDLTFRSAFQEMEMLWAKVEAHAKANDLDPKDVPVFYEYAFNQMNRLQMLGGNNPQNSKLMREAFMATRSTLDLAKPGQYQAFMLAIGQHLGLKVHKKPIAEIVADTESLLGNGKMAEAVALLVDWTENRGSGNTEITADDIDVIKDALGKDMSPVAVHSLMEYARYLTAGQEGLSQFETSLYLEADGVTNGPGNAIQLFTPWAFEEQWLDNMARVGATVGSPGPVPIHELVSAMPKDLYETTTDSLQKRLVDAVTVITNRGEKSVKITGDMRHVFNMLDMFSGGDVNFEGTKFEFKRGFSKNPLTVSLYGSMEGGIANKITKAIHDGIYEKFSEALERMAQNPDLSVEDALFPGFPERAADFVEGYYALTGLKLKLDKKTLVNFKADGVFINTMGEVVKDQVVAPLRAAINDTLGQPVQDAMTAIRQATQLQSIMARELYIKLRDEKLAEKAKDPEWRKEDFLSQEELSEIERELETLGVTIQHGDQNLNLMGGERADDATNQFSTTLAGKRSTPAFSYIPKNIGVKGIPAFVISAADGMMMQKFSELFGAEGTSDVFDGMNVALNKLAIHGRNINQAVYEAWQRNPIKGLVSSFERFVENAELNKLSPEAYSEIRFALFAGAKGKIDNDMIVAEVKNLLRVLKVMDLRLDARIETLKEFGMSVDHMAGAAAPFHRAGTRSLDGMNSAEKAKALNEVYHQKLAELKQKRKFAEETDLAPEVDALATRHESGARVLDTALLKPIAKKLKASGWQQGIIDDTVETLVDEGYRVVAGTPDQLRAWMSSEGMPTSLLADVNTPGSETKTNGLTIPSQKVVLLVNPNAEVLVHEMIHAATIAVVDAYYNGTLDKGFHPMKKAGAIKRIEALMDQFLGLDVSQESEETQKAYDDAVAAITQYVGKDPAAALNEFMAWGLSNQKLGELMSKTKATPLALMAQKLIALIKRVLFGNKNTPVLNDMLTNLRFNTKIVALPNPSVIDVVRETALHHSESYGNDMRLVDLVKTLDRKVLSFVDARLRNEPQDEAYKSQRQKGLYAELMASGISVDTIPAEFRMNGQQKSVFHTMVAVMASAVDLDSNALNKASEIFIHAGQHLDIMSFRRNPDVHDPDDERRATVMFDYVMGYLDRRNDPQGRSSMLPVFVALATVQPDVRKALARIPLPEGAKTYDGTADTYLENVVEMAMDKLADKVSGVSKSDSNVQEVIDSLVDRLAKTAADAKSEWELTASKPGNFVDKVNEVVADKMEKAAEATFQKASQIQASTSNPFVKGAATAAKVLAGAANRRIGNELAETAMMDLSANRDLPRWVLDAINNIVGRTESNAPIFDLIKKVGVWVQQRRQQYREHLPQFFASKFSRVLEDTEWAELFRGLGKTDVTALRGRYSLADILGMLSDSTKVSQEITKLEAELQTLQPRMFQTLQDKSKQLANYMVTGSTGNMLLTNAEAISDLVGMRKPKGYKAAVSQSDLVDALVSLYALNQTDKDTLSKVAELTGSEKDGVSFLLNYMHDQRKRELEKASGNARYNYYKGYLPQEKKEASTLVVAKDEDFMKMREQSFELVGVYDGSDLDPSNERRSYYFAPVSQRAAYSQGIMQNVHHTVGGVDQFTGRTYGPTTAGMITTPFNVDQIYKDRFNENANENLLPRWNADGEIVAWERTVAPAMLDMLQREEHLGKAVANLQGRQAEEHDSIQVNNVLLSRMYRMWENDTKSGANGVAYVDIFDEAELKNDPVLKDIVDTMPGHLLYQIDQMFDGKFPVRRDMLDDTLGYRDPSVRNLWDKKSRWDPKTLDTVKSVLVGTFGADAYKYMVNGEKIIQNLALDIRLLISVKSMIVPMANMTWNVVQLITRGVPLLDIKRGVPRKVAEVNSYLKTRQRLIDIEAELTGETKITEIARLKNEAQIINDDHRRLSIWPLIEAGEFTSISDGMLARDDLALSQGKLSEYFEKAVDKLPPQARTLAKYGLVARDTALFRGLQRTVEYGDFIAKAVLFDELTKRKSQKPEQALAMITEEFVHYDRLPGRDRGYVEQMGLAWFWNFKLRSTKVALSMVRNNPVHALLAMNMPFPDLFGPIGSPLTDNAAAVVLDGRAGASIGLEMAFRAPGLIPGVNFAPV